MALTQVPIELSSTPGIVDNSNATAITIDSSENLLIGQSTTTIPGIGNTTAGVSIRGTDGSFFSRALGSGDTNNVVSVNRSTANGNILGFQYDGTTVGSILSSGGDGIIVQGVAAGSGLLFHNSDALLPAQNANAVDATIDLGRSTPSAFRFKDLYLSGGVVFGDAGGSGTSTSNSLDSYEEGTWTPVLSGSGYSFGTHTGTYVKIGRVVTVTGNLVVSGVGTNTSSISISGYPFSSLNATGQFQQGVVREVDSTGRMYIIQINVNTTIGGLNSMDGVTSGSNEIFTTGAYGFTLTYIADS